MVYIPLLAGHPFLGSMVTQVVRDAQREIVVSTRGSSQLLAVSAKSGYPGRSTLST